MYNEEDFQQSGAGWWIRVIAIVVYVAIIVAYGIQTLELVTWLIPDDNLFMRIVTVFVCDGCATGYATAEMFYRFRLRKSKHIAVGMWVVTFTLSTGATVIQMYLSSTHAIPHMIDPAVITAAYALVITAFVVNIIMITVIIRLEYGASQPSRHYLDDPRKKALPAQVRRAQVSRAQIAAVSSRPAQKTIPQPRMKQIPPPAPDMVEEEMDDQEEPEPEMEADDLDVEFADMEEEEDISQGTDTQFEEEAVAESVPLGQRLGQAWEALTQPSATGPKKLKKRR